MHRFIFFIVLLGFSCLAQKQSLIIDNGHDSFQVRLNLINSAKEEILINYYIFKDDQSGNRFIAALVKAKRHNPDLKIKMIIDGYYNGISKSKLKYLNTIGIEIKNYAPFNLLRQSKLLKRMHTKLLLIDQEYLLIGGRNIKDEYFDLDDNNFHDREIVFKSRDMGLSSAEEFNELWQQKFVEYPHYKRVNIEEIENAKNTIQDFIDELDTSEFDLNQTVQKYSFEALSNTRIVYDGLTKSAKNNTTQELLELLKNAKESVIIESPYFVLFKDTKEIIFELLERGVKVRILTNSLASNDVLFSQSAYQRVRPKLNKLGAELYEYNDTNTTLHAKSFLIDSKVAIVGSYNLNARSYDKDLENIIISENPEVIAALQRSLDENLKKYSRIDNKVDLRHQTGKASFGRKVGSSLSRIVILPFIIGQL